MKRVLLGTTALVAAGAFAVSAAQADEMMAEPVTVGIAGYTMGAIGFASDSDDDTRGHGIKHVYEFCRFWLPRPWITASRLRFMHSWAQAVIPSTSSTSP